MFDALISNLAPHYCLSCGEIGAQICDNCFFDIELTPREQCVKCQGPLVGLQCPSCLNLAGVVQVVLAERNGILKRLVDEYKFQYKRATYQHIARFFDAYAPFFPTSTYIVPLPTASTHIRRRGFDHTRDFSKEFAKRRSYHYSPLIARRHNKAQVGATATERLRQASAAFAPYGELPDKDALYVVCDDITTTGASIVSSVECMRRMGAERVGFVVLMRQT